MDASARKRCSELQCAAGGTIASVHVLMQLQRALYICSAKHGCVQVCGRARIAHSWARERSRSSAH